MFPDSRITGLDRPSCLEDLIRGLRVLLHPVPLPVLMGEGGSNECWLNLTLGTNEEEKKKTKKNLSLLCDSITSENFYSLGDLFIRWWWIQFVRDVRDSDGAHTMLLWCEDAAVEGSQAARERGEIPFCQGDVRDLSRGMGPKRVRGRWSSGKERQQGMQPRPALPFPNAYCNLQNAKPGQNVVRFVSNIIANQSIILASRRGDERGGSF